MKELPKTKMLTTREVAKLLGVHPTTIGAARRSGKIKIPFFRIGGAIRYQIDDVQRFVDAQRVA